MASVSYEHHRWGHKSLLLTFVKMLRQSLIFNCANKPKPIAFVYYKFNFATVYGAVLQIKINLGASTTTKNIMLTGPYFIINGQIHVILRIES